MGGNPSCLLSHGAGDLLINAPFWFGTGLLLLLLFFFPSSFSVGRSEQLREKPALLIQMRGMEFSAGGLNALGELVASKGSDPPNSLFRRPILRLSATMDLNRALLFALG